jgi:hypothetical protein
MPKGTPPGGVRFFVGPKKGTKKRALHYLSRCLPWLRI